MKDCSLTEFKASVSDNNLPAFGSIELKVGNTQGVATGISRCGGTQESPVKVSISSGTVNLYPSGAPAPEIEVSGNVAIQYTTNAPANLYIDKYKIAYLHISSSILLQDAFVLNLEQLRYATELLELSLNHFPYVGSINNLDKSIKLTYLAIKRPLNQIVSGDVVSLVKAWISNGRSSSGSITVAFVHSNCKITFNGTEVLKQEEDASLVWESANKMYILYTNDVMCVGYTDEEIATNTASGGIWEGKTAHKCD